MNTYPAETMRRDLEMVLYKNSSPPVVIVNPSNVDPGDAQEAEKWRLLQEFMDGGYEVAMDNGTYRIYLPKTSEYWGQPVTAEDAADGT